MRPISRWGHMFSTTVSIQARTTNGAYGAPQYGTAVTYRAHLNANAKIVRDANGAQVISSQSVHIMSNVAVLPTAKVTLSTADVGSTETGAISPQIVAVERRFDQNGPHHTVLRLA